MIHIESADTFQNDAPAEHKLHVIIEWLRLFNGELNRIMSKIHISMLHTDDSYVALQIYVEGN